MSSQENLTICALRMIFSVLSWMLIFPRSLAKENLSFYTITILIFVLGKVIDQAMKADGAYDRLSIIIYIVGVIAGIAAIGFAFWQLISGNYYLQKLLLVLASILFGVDIYEFCTIVIKVYKTKESFRNMG